MIRLPIVALVLLSLVVGAGPARSAGAEGKAGAEWKAGVAAVKITPQTSMPMAGYAARKKPSEGVALDLYAKALAVEDAGGHRLVVVTCDLIGVPRALRDKVEKRVLEKHRLPPACLVVNASHTHCGPELRVERLAENRVGEEQQRAGADYVAGLEERLVALVGRALAQLAPARLDYLHARAGFAMNRRRPTARGFTNAPYSDGPVDHDVPVLRVSDPQGKLRAVMFGYACHNTTLPYYKFCGDYAGFAQQYLQEDLPGVTALFVAGCGADQNPYPRGTEERARQHGRTLATAVEAALETVPRPLGGPLVSAAEEVAIDFAPPPAREELQKIAAGKREPDAGHARRLLEELDTSGKIRTSYPYRIQVVRSGDDLVLVALAGEVVVDYSLRLKRELAGPAVWIAGYCNDVFGYVPSLRVLKEGGYEAGEATKYGPLPGPFAASIEERIIAGVKRVNKGATHPSQPK